MTKAHWIYHLFVFLFALKIVIVCDIESHRKVNIKKCNYVEQGIVTFIYIYLFIFFCKKLTDLYVVL